MNGDMLTVNIIKTRPLRKKHPGLKWADVGVFIINGLSNNFETVHSSELFCKAVISGKIISSERDEIKFDFVIKRSLFKPSRFSIFCSFQKGDSK